MVHIFPAADVIVIERPAVTLTDPKKTISLESSIISPELAMSIAVCKSPLVLPAGSVIVAI